MEIDLGDRGDLVGEVHRQLRQAVLDGRLAPGQKLPPSRDLASQLNVSRATVVTAYDRLQSEGYLVSRVGAGTFVSDAVSQGTSWLRRETPTDTTLKPRELWRDVTVPDAPSKPPDYDFRPGIPDARQFPYDVWRRLLGRELQARGASSGAYGDPAGHLKLRTAIARHIRQSRGMDASADDITITNGTQQAVDLIARVLVDPGDQAAIEDPGYQPPRQLFATLGAHVVDVPVDGEGLVVDAIPARTRLVYASPAHQFPLGTTMSLRRRLALLEWAQVHDAAIIEDDYDSEFAFDSPPVEPLQTLDRHGRVLYVGSFSKSMLNTLRLGYVVAPESLHQAIRAAKFVTDWHTSLPVQGALAEFIADGWYARHVRRMRAVYQDRYDEVVTILRRDFAAEFDVVDGPGGLHVTAMAKGGVDVQRAVRMAANDGAGFHRLAGYTSHTSKRPPDGIVVGYGAIATERIAAGLAILRAALST